MDNTGSAINSVDAFERSLDQALLRKDATWDHLSDYQYVASILIQNCRGNTAEDDCRTRLFFIKSKLSQYFAEKWKFFEKRSLSPESWYSEHHQFIVGNAVDDYLSAGSQFLTEYSGRMHQWAGRYWMRDAEPYVRSRFQNSSGEVTNHLVHEFTEALRNRTRNTDPEMRDKPLEEIKPLPSDTIPIETGLLNLITGELTPHSSECFYVNYLPRRYHKGSSPEIFLEFLGIVFKDDPQKDQKIVQIFETVAWTLMQHYNIHGAVILYGQGGEGKSIVHTVIETLLHFTSNITLDALEKEKFERIRLYGSWANFASESTARIIGSEMFKRVTDWTRIILQDKGDKAFPYRSHAKWIVDTNELPIKTDELRAFYRRVICIIDFKYMLEESLSPAQIDQYVRRMTDSAELDRIFSYVVDNFYPGLAQRMKFTGQFNLEEAERSWTERSDPALAYIKMKLAEGLILQDIEDAKTQAMELNTDLHRIITKEKDTFDEYLVTLKDDVVAECVKWATKSGFPLKKINSGSIGAALKSQGLPNVTVDKKLSRNLKPKAWRDIWIVPGIPEIQSSPDRLETSETRENDVGDCSGKTESRSNPSTSICKLAWSPENEDHSRLKQVEASKQTDNSKSRSITDVSRPIKTECEAKQSSQQEMLIACIYTLDYNNNKKGDEDLLDPETFEELRKECIVREETNQEKKFGPKCECDKPREKPSKADETDSARWVTVLTLRDFVYEHVTYLEGEKQEWNPVDTKRFLKKHPKGYIQLLRKESRKP